MLATLLVKCKSSYTPLKALKSLFFHSEKAKILQKGLQGPHPQHPQPDLISHHALQASLTFCFSNKQRCPPASWPWHRHSLFPCTLKGLYSFPYSLITVSPLRMNLQDANFQRCEHASGSRRNWNPCHQHQAWVTLQLALRLPLLTTLPLYHLPPPVSNSSCLFTRCQHLYASVVLCSCTFQGTVLYD